MVRAGHIKSSHLLSVQLLLTCSTPIAGHGIRVIWKDLILENLEQLNRVKASFSERTLKLHIVTRNCFVYFLDDSSLMPKKARRCRNGNRTRSRLSRTLWDLFTSRAMRNSKWQETKLPNSHDVTRFPYMGSTVRKLGYQNLITNVGAPDAKEIMNDVMSFPPWYHLSSSSSSNLSIKQIFWISFVNLTRLAQPVWRKAS